MRSTIIRTLAAAALFAGPAFTQSLPTSTLRGRVSDELGGVMREVTVTVSSSALQGKRSVVTGETGDYILSLLPPGDYEVRFAREGFRSTTTKIALRAGSSAHLDHVMELPSLTELEIVVLGERPADVLEAPQIATSYKAELIETLPVGRTISQIALLAGGVADSGPSNALRISGGPSFENLFLVNGVVVNENLRGQPHDLFIEDAVQETTVMTGNVSAEFGRFTGGVVNVVTKSGGNRFSGSYRTSLTNDDWLATTPFKETKIDDVNLVHELTLGGPIVKERVWFFGAARIANTSDGRETRPTLRPGDIDPRPIPYPHERHTRRLEGKVTGALNADHRVVASLIDIADEEVNFAFTQNVLDLASLVTRKVPNRLLAFNYNGILSPRVFVDAQYSRKDYTIANGGSAFTDLVKGTLLVDQSRSSARFNSPTFSNDTAEQRDSHSAALKMSYFLPTAKLGAHDIRVGYEGFAESRYANNYQSGSGYRILATGAVVRGTDVFPVFGTGGTTVIQYNPIAERTQGSDLAMHSLFVNDKVAFGRKWNLSAGLRFDKNDAKDSRGAPAARDAGFSPRLSASYDVRGDGTLTVTAGFNKYVAKIAEGPAVAGSAAGNSAEYRWLYQGPAINADVNAPTAQLVPADQAITRVLQWFTANGGLDRRPFERAPVIPGVSERLEGTLASPNVKEVTFGAGLALGRRGYVRADLVHRDWDDFYASHVDRNTGQTDANELGQRFDLSLVHNSEYFDRKYAGVQLHLRYRVTDALQVGGNYTWSHLTGNHVGENVVSGPVTGQARGYLSPLYDDSFEKYPEYRQDQWNNPRGVLPGDQPHRARLWAGYDLKTRFGTVNLSVLQSLDSGLPYEAIGNIDPSPYVTNPGYLSPPVNRNYFFSEPGAFRTDFITRTDLALSYSLKKFRTVEVFAQPELLNVFNQHGVVLGRGDALGAGAALGIDTTVLTRKTQTGFLAFNPFRETPVRGERDAANPTAHYDLSPTFGQPTSKNGYQLPRAFRVSVGVRF